MSFSFSFSGDDIEDDSNDNRNTDDLATRLQNVSIAPTPLIPPKRHTFAELLESLPDQISYNWLDVPLIDVAPPEVTSKASYDALTSHGQKLRVPRRALFDIRQQLMVEDDTHDAVSDSADEPEQAKAIGSQLLAGLETGDLSTGIYEGGFKTWECAVDLAGYVAGLQEAVGAAQETSGQGRVTRVIELGAGSATPSLVLLRDVVRRRRKKTKGGKGTVGNGKEQGLGKESFTLCDYNEDVLRLCTAVNVFLSIALELDRDEQQDQAETVDEQEEADMEVDEELVKKTLQELEEMNIEIDFISGAWGERFVELLDLSDQDPGSKSSLVVLASETIYSPESLGVFSQTVLEILGRSGKDDQQWKLALIAAKKVYFGVGGGVQEFEQELQKRGGRMKTALDINEAGVGRVVLGVMHGEDGV